MGKGSWWGPSSYARDERATPVEEDLKQPKLVRHEVKPISVQWRTVQTSGGVWTHHKYFESTKKAEAWILAMNTRERRRHSTVRAEYRVDPIHYGVEPEAPAPEAVPEKDQLPLAQRAILGCK